ncbi:hypothetical protein ACROYT_G018227 [Oculina patagonica]
MIIDSWIAEAEHNDEDEIPSYEKASDPRYCHCRLCMSSDDTDHLKSSAFLLNLSLEDLKIIFKDNDILQKEEGQHLHSKDKHKRAYCLVSLLRGLKILPHDSSVQHPFSALKETLRKARAYVPRACSFRPLCQSNSCVKVDEGGIVRPFVTEKEPTINIDQMESVGQTEPVSNPLPKSTSNLNLDDISAIPFERKEVPSRVKKKTKLAAHSTPSSKKWIFALCPLFIALALTFFIVCIIQGRLSLKDAPPKDHRSAVTETATGIPTLQGSKDLPNVICSSRKAPDCLSRCPSNDIALVDLATGEHDCWPCPTCPPGKGLSFPCGSVVRKGTSIKCFPCEAGITFSSSYNESVCQNCSQCAPKETVMTSCKPHSDVVCSRCQSKQITWISSKKEKYECFDCPICKPGFEPSHPCGSTIPYGVLITCVQCREGETFSDMTDSKQCKRCSSCPPGRRLIERCTKYFDTICGIPSSLECGRHEIQLEVKRRGQTRNQTQMICVDCLMCPAGMEPSVPCGGRAHWPGVHMVCVPCLPGLTYSDQPSKYRCRPCTACPPGAVVISWCSVHTNTRCSTNSRCLPNQITISSGFKPTCADCIKCSVGMEPSIPCGSRVTSLRQQQCAPCILSSCFYFKTQSQKQLLTKFKEARTRRWKDIADEITLEDLDAGHIELFDWICRKLDRGFRRDYERLAKMYDRISPEARRSLRDERKNPGGSPSRLLMNSLQSLYPSLTLSDFISALAQIGRHDIAQRLIPLVLRRSGQTAYSVQEDFV